MLKISPLPHKGKKRDGLLKMGGTLAGIFLVALFSLLSMVAVPTSISITPPMESFRILLNLLFTISEGYQRYQYTHFPVSVPVEVYPRYIFTAFALVAIGLFAYVFAIVKWGSRPMAFGLWVAITGLQIYFGVFAAPLWNIALCAVIGWFILRNTHVVIFPAFVVATAVLVVALYTAPSPTLTQLGEDIRDRFGEQVPREQEDFLPPPTTLPQNAQTITPDLTGQQGSQEGGMAIGMTLEERFSGSQIGTAIGQRIWLLWLIALGFVLWFLGLWVAKYVKAHRHRQVFYGTDHNLAVDKIFRHATGLLVAFGNVTPHETFANYHLPSAASPQYVAGYHAALALWEQAVYSHHTIGAKDRDTILTFLRETKTLLCTGKGFWQRTKTRLGMEWFTIEQAEKGAQK